MKHIREEVEPNVVEGLYKCLAPQCSDEVPERGRWPKSRRAVEPDAHFTQAQPQSLGLCRLHSFDQGFVYPWPRTVDAFGAVDEAGLFRDLNRIKLRAILADQCAN